MHFRCLKRNILRDLNKNQKQTQKKKYEQTFKMIFSAEFYLFIYFRRSNKFREKKT